MNFLADISARKYILSDSSFLTAFLSLFLVLDYVPKLGVLRMPGLLLIHNLSAVVPAWSRRV